MTADTYKAQNRGGRGIMGMSRREEDVAKTMFSCSSHDIVFFFTNKGKVFKKKAYEIPASSRTALILANTCLVCSSTPPSTT